MSVRPTAQELLEVQEFFGLPSPGLVEKDWHVVKALAAITAVDPGEFRLVFGGGTAPQGEGRRIGGTVQHQPVHHQ
ncbi:hypothetical protein [Nitrobacter sp.]|uniref:hypothetical protein n=1 Tax=Nitrobacter sp. TaxID=29420 RepID=UPI00399D6040